ncbi:MAG: hypothetical protein KDI63_10655 [Gammaproteobacteria bacterium]|nr:hypothetical protein [Gammaproteobacteria bacterium]
MLKLLQSIFRQTAVTGKNYDDNLLELAIDRVVDGTDTRLKAVSGYRKRLQASVVTALDYTIELVDDLPPPISLSPQRFGKDDYVRSFFVSPDDISEFFTHCRALQRYLETHSGLDPEYLFALLVLTRMEREVFGMKMEGEILRRDIAQTAVSFTQHRLSSIKDEESKSRFEMKKNVFDYFVELALKDIISIKEESRKASQQRDLLSRKLRTLESVNWGMESLLAGKTEKLVDDGRTQQELVQLEAEFQRLSVAPLTLDHYLDSIANSLNDVRARLWKEPLLLKLDRLGIKSDQVSSAITLELNEYCSADGGRIIALPIQIPFDSVPLQPDLLGDVERYL